MINQSIKFSIGLVTYNRRELLIEAVNSVLNQEYQNFELIIANDYVQEPLSLSDLGIPTDDRIRLVNQPKNLGELANMNYVLGQATGDWFTWLGDDDLFHPKFLMTGRSILSDAKTSNLVAIFTNYASGSKSPLLWDAIDSSHNATFDALSFPLPYTSRRIRLIGCYGFFKTKVLRASGGMPCLGTSFGPYGDTLLPIIISQFGQIIYSHGKLMFLRTHPGSLSCSTIDLEAYRTASADFLSHMRFLYKEPNFSRKFLEKLTFNMLCWFGGDDWAILSRNTGIGFYGRMASFARNQYASYLPRLSLAHKIYYLLFWVKKITRFFLIWLYRGLRNLYGNLFFHRKSM